MNKTEDRGRGVVGASIEAMRGCGEKGPTALAPAVSCDGRVLSILVVYSCETSPTRQMCRPASLSMPGRSMETVTIPGEMTFS